MAELDQPNIVGNYLSNYYAAQQKQQAEQDRQRNMMRQDRQDDMAEQQFSGQMDLQKLETAVKRGQAMTQIIGRVRDGDAQGFEAAKAQAVQELGLPPEQVAHLTIADLPRLRAESGQTMRELEIAYKRAQIASEQAQARSYDALAGARAAGPAAGQPGATLSPETVDFMADQYIAGDPSVMVNLGRGIQGAKNIVAIREAIARKIKDAGGSATDVAMAIGEFQGFKAGNRSLGTRTANMGMAVNEANQMADLVVTASDAVPRGQIRAVNDALNAYQSQTGDPKIVRFGAALNSFINAYARAISPTGVPTVNDKEHARDMLNTGFTQGQVREVIDQLKAEMAAASKAPGATKQELRSTFRNEHGGAKPQVSPLDAADAIVGIKR